MKRIKEKLVLILIMALIIGAFDSGLLMASAGVSLKTSWLFKTVSGIKLQMNDTIYMEKNEFQDFNLYKNGKEILENDRWLEVTWSSSDEDVIWINAKTGKSRADRFGTMKGDTGKAVITAKVTNKTTKTPTYRRFKVVVGEEKPEPTTRPIAIITATPKPTASPTPTPTKAPEPASIALQIKDNTDTSKVLEPNYTYHLETLVYDKNKKLIDSDIHNLYFKYFSSTNGLQISGATFTAIKNGEYTITVGAFKTEDEAKSAISVKNAVFTAELKGVKVEASYPVITQIRQMTLDTVRLTFNAADYAQELVKDASLLKVKCSTKLYSYSVPVNTITKDDTDECSVLVEMRSCLTESYNYEYSFNGEESAVASVIGSGTTPASIRLVGGPVEAQVYYPLEVKVYSNRGVDITDTSYYAIQYKSLTYNVTDITHQLSGSHIWFTTEGKSAVIEASLDLGYDDKGNKLPVLTSNAQFYSVPKSQPVYTRSQLFALADEQSMLTPAKIKYLPSTQTICMGDYQYYAVAAFNYVDSGKQESTQYIVSGRDTTGSSYNYTYRSADPSVLLVGETAGNLVPIETGSTVIYIVQHTEFPIDESKGTVVATIPVNVVPERALETFALTEQSSINLSTTGNTNGDEFVTIRLRALDQQGDAVAAKYSFSMVEPAGTAFSNLFNYSIENDILKIWEGAGLNNLVDKDLPRSVLVTVTASYNGVQRQQNFQLQVKNTKTSDVYTSELYITNPRVDTKLDVTDLNHYISTIKVRSIDKGGYFIRLENFTYVKSIQEAPKENGVFSVLITETADDTNASDLVVEATNKELRIKAVSVKNDTLTKAKKGTYKISLYRGNGSDAVHVMTKGFEVTDTSTPLTVIQTKFSLLFADTTMVNEAITVVRGSTDITEHVTIQDMKSVRVDNILVVYEIYANVRTKEQNEEWNEKYHTSVTITPERPLQFVIGQ